MDNLLWNFIETFNDTFLREDFKKHDKSTKIKYSSNENNHLNKDSHNYCIKKNLIRKNQRNLNKKLRELNKRKESFKSSKKVKSNKSSKKPTKKSSTGSVGAQHHRLSSSAKSKYVSAFTNTFINKPKHLMLPKKLSLEKNTFNILLPTNKKI